MAAEHRNQSASRRVDEERQVLFSVGARTVGGAGQDVLRGSDGDDTLDGATGDDWMSGGNGDDVYVVSSAFDEVLENADGGRDTVRSHVSYALRPNVENLVLEGTENIQAIGNALNNRIIGNAGSNYIDGGGGVDEMLGGFGDDLYVIDSSFDIVFEESGGGNDSVQSSVSYALGENLEQLTLIGIGDIQGIGNGLSNRIVGNGGANYIDGGLGADVLIGAAGDDTYVVDNSFEVIIEVDSQGYDTVFSTVSYALRENVEALTLLSDSELQGIGNAQNNVIRGNGVSNYIDGGAGNDFMIGGRGNDFYVIDSSFDAIVEEDNQGDDTAYTNVSFALTQNVENLRLFGTSNIQAIGSDFNNLIVGNSGADYIDGRAGFDFMIGGLGDDFYVVDHSFDAIVEESGEGIDTALSSVNYALTANVESLRLTGAAVQAIGNIGDNTLYGTASANLMMGGGGADSMWGGGGDDVYIVDNVNDAVVEANDEGADQVVASVSYTLTQFVERLSLTGSATHATGSSLANTLIGSHLNNVLSGLGGNDTLDGGAGADAMNGGSGDDTFFVDNAGDEVIEASGGGNDTVRSIIDHTLAENVESLVLSGEAILGSGNELNNQITGSGTNNLLIGGGGADTIDGGGGADFMIGGAENDVYIVNSADDAVNELIDDGADEVRSSISYTLGDHVERLILTGTAISGTGNELDNAITGNGVNNTLFGGAGKDTLDGGLGVDTLTGGANDDVYHVDDMVDVIVEGENAGLDTVYATITYGLGDNIENLYLVGPTAHNGGGNALNNIISGGNQHDTLWGDEGNDTLIGNGGVDTLKGDGGDDVYVFQAGDEQDIIFDEELAGGSDTVSAAFSYTLGVNLENLVLTGTAVSGTGNALANAITGNGANNALIGLAGNDTLDGGVGADTMTGGADNDTYVVDDAGDIVNENADAGTDTVRTNFSYTLGANIENLVLTGTAVSGTGNALANAITGNGANNALIGLGGIDTLDGGIGADTMTGGTDDDMYYVDNIGDEVTELTGEGTDTVRSAINYALGAHVENLTLIGSATTGTGNNRDNRIVGTDGANTLEGGDRNDTLDGGGGIDRLVGGSGDDVYHVDSANDVLVEAGDAGIDAAYSTVSAFILSANVENLYVDGDFASNGGGNTLNNLISGGSQHDTLWGDAGADTLIGNGGRDTLLGQLGDDVFILGVGDETDEITEESNSGVDSVVASFNYTLGDHVENLTLDGAASIGVGNSHNNKITGAGNNDSLTGLAGNDTLDGGVGADTMTGGADNDTYYVDSIDDVVTEVADQGGDAVFSSIDYTLGAHVEQLFLLTSAISGTGNSLNNQIFGSNAQNNQLFGGDGNDTLWGNAGADTMTGGAHDDSYQVDNVADEVVELANEGTDEVQSSISYTLGEHLERLTLTGTAISGTGNAVANMITGNGENNSLTGGAGNDVLNGAGGADTMTGGADDDSYFVDHAGDSIVEALDEGLDTVGATADYALADNVENLTLMGAAVTGTGNALNNLIYGNVGNNRLNGGAGNDTLNGAVVSGTMEGGADTLDGGADNDLYYIDSATDVVIEGVDGGDDSVHSSVNHTLAEHVENLILNGGATTGVGNDLANVITGNTLVNSLTGGGGNDFIDGGVGADSMTGGLGDDTFTVDNIGDVTVEDENGGDDLVRSSVSFTLGDHVERLLLTGTAIAGTGNGLRNTITGNGQNNALNGGGGGDVLIGGIGADTMTGGAENDSYEIDDAGDVVTEYADEGLDTVNASITYTLLDHFEFLTLTGAAISGAGNGLNNVITGNGENNQLFGHAGNDSLLGNAGADTMAGGANDDTYSVDNIGDEVVETADNGTDTVSSLKDYTLGDHVENLLLQGTAMAGVGNSLANAITGNVENNTLDGGAGNDTLDGGFGADTMEGGADDDRYVVNDAGDVVTEDAESGTDTVVSSVDYDLGDNVERLILTGDAMHGNGNALANVITGSGLRNALTGGEGADTLDGGADWDIMSGGDGDDVYYVDNTLDLLFENDGQGNDLVYSSVSLTLATHIERLVLTEGGAVFGNGNALANAITGNNGANQLYGNNGDDTLDGGIGADTMEGGANNDTYIVDNAGDSITEQANAGTDSVLSSISWTLAANFERLTLTGTAIVGTGNTLANLIIGSDENNNLSGGDEKDTLEGGVGNDTLDGGTGVDSMTGGANDDTYIVDNAGDVLVENANEGIDTVQTSLNWLLAADFERLVLTGAAIGGAGNSADNSITGNGENNLLTGGAGNDTLDGGVGADTMEGGLNNDTFIVDNAGDVVTEAASEGTDTVRSSHNWTLGTHVEHLTLTGAAISGTGNALANMIIGNGENNTLYGLGENDTLDGGIGADTMEGGANNDTYIVDDAGDVVTEAADAGTDTVQSSITWTLGDNVERLTLTGTAISGTGNALANTITGNGANNTLGGLVGNDTIDGGQGRDTMTGGVDDDTYYVNEQHDSVVELANEGVDTVYSSATLYYMADHVERLTLLEFNWAGTYAFFGMGNGASNLIIGNELTNMISGFGGDDTLDGAGGADSMYGHQGDDTFYVDHVNDEVFEFSDQGYEGDDRVFASVSYTLAANVERLTLTGTAVSGTGNTLANTITGNGENNTIYGLDQNDTLNGGAGDDTLDGGSGVDSMTGGANDDTYIVDNGGDVVTEATNEGSDTVQSSVNWTLGAHVERLTLTGTAISGTGNTLANTITGNGDNNTIYGLGGNDTLDGGVGADTMEGGADDDTYVVNNAGDVVTEATTEGSDTVQSSINWTLVTDVEHLTLTGAAISGTGNTLANTITGNGENNALYGLGGNDTLDGGVGADTMEGGADDDTYIVDNAGDVVTEATIEGSDTVQSSVNWTLGAHIEHLTLTGAAISGTGNTLANIVTGNSENNTIYGLDGNDRLDGGIGADTMEGGAGDDTFTVDNVGDVVTEGSSAGTDTVQSSVNYTLGSNVEILTLTGTTVSGTGNTLGNTITGNGSNNTLYGLDGNDTLDGGAGADTMEGGADDDTFVVDNAGDVVTEGSSAGTDTVQSSVSWTLGANVERLTLTSAAISGTGNALANTLTSINGSNFLYGLDGDDTLIGGIFGGSDYLAGGADNDTYYVDNTSDVVFELTNQGDDLVYSSSNFTLLSHVERLILTGSAISGTGQSIGNTITGNSINNTLFGLAGNDTLDGGVGADSMTGGANDDTYIVDNAGDVVTEASNAGIDTVQSSISWLIGDNVERLTLTGAAVSGTGNALANIITGNDQNNSLSGDDENDTLNGGLGNDSLDGGAGEDSMTGGANDDTYTVDSAFDVVVESADGGIDTVLASVNWTLGANVERLTLTGDAEFGFGNGLANVITGNGVGNDLTGGAGDDTLISASEFTVLRGGADNDSYYIGDFASGQVIENANEGTDTVFSGHNIYTLGQNIERLHLVDAAVNGLGNALANTITGNANNNALVGDSGNDTLDGGEGADTMQGNSDDDTYVVDNVGDVVTEGVSAGTDTVQSSISYTLGANVERLTLTGTAAFGTGNTLANTIIGNDENNTLYGLGDNDVLIGGGGADSLEGGVGNDSLTGGDGNDIFAFSVSSDSDVILDYQSGQDTVRIDREWLTGNVLDSVIGNDLIRSHSFIAGFEIEVLEIRFIGITDVHSITFQYVN